MPIKHQSNSGNIKKIIGISLIFSGLISLPVALIIGNTEATVANKQVDLLTYDWSHMAGAKTGADRKEVEILPLGRAIVNQDGSDNQSNPPVNVLGPRLSFRNKLQLDYLAANISTNGKAKLYLYSKTPIIYDEWRYQPPQLMIEVAQQGVAVYGWNGHSDTYAYSKSWEQDIGSSAFVSLYIDRNSNSIDIQVNGARKTTLKPKRIFASGEMVFGADATKQWTLKKLTVQSPATSKLITHQTNNHAASANTPDSLKELSTSKVRQLAIGSAVSNYSLFSDSQYSRLVVSQINQLIPENELKAQFIHPQPDIYSFTEADNLVDFAQANGMSLHGHNLVFSEANPKWMQKSLLSQREEIMTQHVSTVVSHYKDKIQSWDVVDEPLNDNDDNKGDARDLRQNIWFKAMGEEYIDKAFLAAHNANPTAQLYINEYGLEADGPRWQEFLKLLKRLQMRGVPIHGVGFQAHVYEPGDEISQNTLMEHMETLAKMGLKSRISEMDVYGDDYRHQADQYSQGLRACFMVPSCTAFTMWGISDRYGSTTTYHDYPLNYGNSLVWDENLQVKKAYNYLQMVLKNQKL